MNNTVNQPDDERITDAGETSAIGELIERSSLGTADAQAMRARTSTARAAAVVARAEDLRILGVDAAHEQALLVESLSRRLDQTRQRMEAVGPADTDPARPTDDTVDSEPHSDEDGPPQYDRDRDERDHEPILPDLSPLDDGPGRDQYGPHDAPTAMQQLVDTMAAADPDRRITDVDEAYTAALGECMVREMSTGQVVTVEHFALPAPAERSLIELIRDYGSRVGSMLYSLGRNNVIPDGSPPAAELLTEIEDRVRELEARAQPYTDTLTLHADDLDVPPAGPRWQVTDAKDETTWHDLDAIAECELGEACPIAASLPSDVECIVLVGTAWADGFAHTPADAMIDVRIPVVTR